MDSSKITLIGNSKHLKIFLSKNYGLMLLFILEELAEKKLIMELMTHMNLCCFTSQSALPLVNFVLY